MNIKHFFYLPKKKKKKHTFSTTTRCCLFTRIKNLRGWHWPMGDQAQKLKREEKKSKETMSYIYNKSTVNGK